MPIELINELVKPTRDRSKKLDAFDDESEDIFIEQFNEVRVHLNQLISAYNAIPAEKLHGRLEKLDEIKHQQQLIDFKFPRRVVDKHLGYQKMFEQLSRQIELEPGFRT